MSRPSVFLIVALLGVLAWLACTSNPAGPVVRAAPKDELDYRDVRDVEMSAIYTTSEQKNLKDVFKRFKDSPAERETVVDIAGTLDEAKSPAVLTFVRGEHIREAVLASARYVKAKPRPATPIGPDDKSTSKKYWLFVYLGHASSSPHNWLITPPTVFGTRVRFMYTSFDGWLSDVPIGEAIGHRAYLYWVPVGEAADPNEWKAELVELTQAVKAAYPAKKD